MLTLHAVNLLVAVGFLKRLGYAAAVVVNGLEVMRALETTVFDVIFLDVEMPEMDGYETARLIRKQWAAREAERPRLIAMTGHAMKEDRDRCLEAGMDDYISKPVNPKMLQAVLQRALAVPAASSR